MLGRYQYRAIICCSVGVRARARGIDYRVGVGVTFRQIGLAGEDGVELLQADGAATILVHLPTQTETKAGRRRGTAQCSSTVQHSSDQAVGAVSPGCWCGLPCYSYALGVRAIEQSTSTSESTQSLVGHGALKRGRTAKNSKAPTKQEWKVWVRFLPAKAGVFHWPTR